VPQGLWQSFKLVKKTPAGEQAGQEVVDIEYRYDLITSGPIVGRHGFARIVHVGGSAVALGATTSDTRFKVSCTLNPKKSLTRVSRYLKPKPYTPNPKPKPLNKL
jgi:hypothetical protein